MSELNFKISAESKSATKVIAKARQFEIIIDEPQDLGGKDEAPNPVETLLASYAGCFNVVLHLLAKERNIEINHLKIDINGNINDTRPMTWASGASHHSLASGVSGAVPSRE